MESAELPDDNPVYEYTDHPKRINELIMIALYIWLVVEVLSLIPGSIWVYALHTAPHSHHFVKMLTGTDTGFIYLIDFLYIVAGIIFLRWVYVMNRNCHGFGAEAMNYSPGWSVGWYFVPILGFFMPFSVMSEIRRVSSDPANWRKYSAGWLVVVWWACWIETWVLGAVARLSRYDLRTLDQIQIAFDWSLAHRVSVVLSLVVVILLVRDISHRQAWLVSEQGALSPDTALKSA